MTKKVNSISWIRYNIQNISTDSKSSVSHFNGKYKQKTYINLVKFTYYGALRYNDACQETQIGKVSIMSENHL